MFKWFKRLIQNRGLEEQIPEIKKEEVLQKPKPQPVSNKQKTSLSKHSNFKEQDSVIKQLKASALSKINK